MERFGGATISIARLPQFAAVFRVADGNGRAHRAAFAAPRP